MSVNVGEYVEDSIVDIERPIEYTYENEEIKSLVYYKNKNKMVTYFTAVLKRVIDICAGIVGVIVLIPLSLMIYIANLISKDKGPVFFIQERIGKNGKIFKMYKYRSMVVGADKKLEKYLRENDEARKEYKEYKKLKDDPRVTKVGKFIRKTSLDEMPQLLNLLTGEMSLVGPRPYLPREKSDMGEYYNIIIKSKPGITGYWQTRGRSNTNFDDRLDLDIKYEKEKCLKKDLQVLVGTMNIVLGKKGAI